MNRILVIIHITILLISCSDRSTNSVSKVFRYNCEHDITSLDPAFASNQDNIWAVTQLFNGLLQLDSNLHTIPGIAKSWEISEDGKIYTFHLRSDVYFHEDICFERAKSRRVLASDFEYTFTRLIDPSTASPGAWIFNDKVVPNGFRALNDSTLEIELIRPFAPFAGILTMPYCMVVPHEAIKYYKKDFSTHPVGTGPFAFKMWEHEVALVFKRNDRYFEKQGLGNVSGIQISFIQNRQMALLMFLEGKLDMFTGITGAVKDFILDKEGELKNDLEGKVQLQKMDFLNTEYLAFHVDESSTFPINNRDFRRGVSLAINRASMLRNLRNNVGNANVGGFVPPALAGSLESRPMYQPDLARELIAASGYHKNPVQITLFTTNDYSDLCLFAQKNLSELGVNCKINVIPSSHLKEEKRQGKLGFFRASWIMDYPDAENYLSCFYSQNFSPGGPNYTHFNNQKFDRLYERSLAEFNDSSRIRLYREMEEILLEESPVVVLFYDKSIRLTLPRVSGLNNNALNIPHIKWVNLFDPV